MNLSINTVLYFVAEDTLRTDILVKLGMDDFDCLVVLINPSRDSAPQIFPWAYVTSFTRLSTDYVWIGNCLKAIFQSEIASQSKCDLIPSSLFFSTLGEKIIHSSSTWSFLIFLPHWSWFLEEWMFLLFSFLLLSALPSEFFEVRALLYFSLSFCVKASSKYSVWVKKIIQSDYRDNIIQQRYWQIPAKLYCLVNSFWAVCIVFTCFDSKPHWHVWFQCKRN